jgi:hypothetical protein
MDSRATDNFVIQQGYERAPGDSNGGLFKALSFQPRVIAPLAVLGVILQSGPYFAVLSAILWWCVAAPKWNPFNAIHNALFAARGAPRLEGSPAPRRFSMGMAASFMLGISISLMAGWTVAAVVLQAFLLVALTALIFGKLCLGSYIYHLLTGQAALANCTLPWARG